MNKPILEVNNVGKTYKEVEAVDDLSLKVYPGEIFGLLGPNGAGKTTLMEMILGLRKPTKGSISIFGCNPLVYGDYKEKVGVQLETTNLPYKSRVKEIFTLFASFYQNSVNIDDLLDFLKIKERKNSYVAILSKGMRKKVGIGLALIGNPDIIFLDEPTSGLDPIMRSELWETLNQIKREGKTIFLTTHLLEEAERFCDRVGIMERGKLIEIGNPGDLIAKIGFKQKIEVNIPKAKLSKDLIQSFSNNGKNEVKYGKSKTSIFTKEPYPIIKNIDESIHGRAEIKLINISMEDVFFEVTGKEFRK